jgi:hypothetical protein
LNPGVVSAMTTATAANDSVAPPRKPAKRLWRIVIALLITAILLVTIVSWLRPPPSRFELISAKDYERRTERFAFVQSARAWMTRFSPRFFRFAPVEISASYVQIGRREESELLARLPSPQYWSNAVRAWIFTSNEVARAERYLRANDGSRWRITTADGISSVLSGPATPTSSFATHPKIRDGNVDLAVIVRSESILNVGRGVMERPSHETTFRVLLKPGEGGSSSTIQARSSFGRTHPSDDEVGIAG